MEPQQILLVDDEPELRSMLRRYLTSEGFEVAAVESGQEALQQQRRLAPDLIVLDVGLPDLDGFELLRMIRAESDVPVIMLTARADEIDRVVGLSVGADDYLVKPASPRELVARIRAVLRRSSGQDRAQNEALDFVGLTIDAASREVRRDGDLVELSALEFDLVAVLAGAPNRVFTREQLLTRVWGWDYFGVDRVVDVHIANIRKALGDEATRPKFIATVRGVGYKFVGEPA